MSTKLYHSYALSYRISIRRAGWFTVTVTWYGYERYATLGAVGRLYCIVAEQPTGVPTVVNDCPAVAVHEEELEGVEDVDRAAK